MKWFFRLPLRFVLYNNKSQDAKYFSVDFLRIILAIFLESLPPLHTGDYRQGTFCLPVPAEHLFLPDHFDRNIPNKRPQRTGFKAILKMQTESSFLSIKGT